MRAFPAAVLCLALAARVAGAQSSNPDSTSNHGRPDKTFLVRRDLGIAAGAFAATALLSRWDTDIAKASQQPRWQKPGIRNFATKVSKVNETTLTAAGIITYGIGRWTDNRTVTDVALHATESVVLASLASQVIRGPLGRARPYVTNDTDQYVFKFGKGFSKFDYRAFPSIHTSSSMAVATVLVMEMHRRDWGGANAMTPVLYGAALLPGLARIPLNQHWASDILAGAVMGTLAGYKVVSYSHDHPDNWFDRKLLKVSVMPDPNGGVRVGFSPF